VGPRKGLDDVEKILAPTGTQTAIPRPVQPVVSRYIDCAIPALSSWAKPMNINGGFNPESFGSGKVEALVEPKQNWGAHWP
jgi:hypothetical protein